MKRIFAKGYSICLALVLLIILQAAGSVCLAADTQKGLVAQYKFDGDFKDSGANKNDGTSTGSVSFSDDGAVGKCAVFKGGNIQIPASASLDLGSAFTFSAWVKLDPDETGANLDGIIVAKENNDKENLLNTYSYQFMTQGIHGLDLSLSQLSNGYSPSVGDDGVGSFDLQEKWCLLTCTDDGQMMYLYIDGKLIASDTPGDDGISFNDAVPGKLYIGGLPDGSNLKGKLDDLRIYNRALSSDEVKKLYDDVMGVYKNKIVLTIGEKDILVNGRKVQIDPDSVYTKPITKDGRTLVPIRAIIENMGGTVNWIGKERRVDITLKGTTVRLWLDNTKAEVNGKQVTLDVPAQSINNRTMVPVRFVAENLGAKVEWDKTTQTVTILYNK